MFRRLLVPLDGSVTAETALPYAEQIARRAGAEILLLRVLPPPPQSAFAPAPVSEEAAARTASEYLWEVAARPSFQGLAVDARTARGYPVSEIAELARRRAGTLVVMASHGHTGLRRTALGSVADKVLHTVRAPVLLIPALGARPPRPETGAGRVIVGLDGSSRAEAVLPWAAGLARLLGLTLLLAHVLPVDAPAEAHQQARAYLERVRDRLADGIPIELSVTEGSPAERLVQEAKARGDMLALASHGRTGLSRWLMGSVTERVVD